MMSNNFTRIKIPNAEHGLTNKQRDMLQVQMADGINNIGDKVCRLDREMYGDRDYPGLKALVHSNTKWVTWLIRALILAGIIGGTGIGLTTVVGG